MRPVLQASYRREDGLPILDGSCAHGGQSFHSEPVGVMKHIFRQSHAELVHQHRALVVRGESNTTSENTQRNKIDFQWCPLRSRRNVEVCGQCLKVCVTAVELARCKAMGPVISTVRATWTIRKQVSESPQCYRYSSEVVSPDSHQRVQSAEWCKVCL